MTFREMTVEDLEQVVEIENRLFSDPWTKEGFFTFLTRDAFSWSAKIPQRRVWL